MTTFKLAATVEKIKRNKASRNLKSFEASLEKTIKKEIRKRESLRDELSDELAEFKTELQEARYDYLASIEESEIATTSDRKNYCDHYIYNNILRMRNQTKEIKVKSEKIDVLTSEIKELESLYSELSKLDTLIIVEEDNVDNK